MRSVSLFNATSAIALPAFVLMMSGTAQAALTANQVWQSWKDGASEIGLELAAKSESKDGNVLSLSDVTGTGSGLVLSVPGITMTGNDDGTVTIGISDLIRLEGSDEKIGDTLVITPEDLILIAREGDEGGVVYDYKAAALSAVLAMASPAPASETGTEEAENPTAPDNAAKPATADFKAFLEDLEGSYADIPGANRQFDFSAAAKKLSYDMNSADPDTGAASNSTNEAHGVNATLNVTLPAGIKLAEIASPADFAKALQGGLAISMTGSQESSSAKSSLQDGPTSYDLVVDSKSSESAVSFDKDKLSIKGASDGSDVSFSSPELPAPIGLTLGKAAMNLSAPVMSGDKTEDFAIAFGVDNVVLTDESWKALDPGAALDHGPASFNVDLAGNGVFDWFLLMSDQTDEDVTISEGFSPQNLNINDISLQLAGAALKVAGALTFKNEAAMPLPVGKIDINVNGINGLVDGLVKIGVLNEADAGQFKMMQASFLKPGEEPDSGNATIEMREDGSVFVNDQRVQ